jgi:formate hydrogenlyase subunit 6/NADH:ubiquinone oxidoreductase subunit I
LCTGCQACVKTCPAQAITGKKDSPHSIDTAQCIKCGACREICPYNAIYAT